MDELEDPRAVWDRRFARHEPERSLRSYEPWLDRWADRLDTARGEGVLDLGCGVGLDARYLSRRGLAVVGVDFSPEALRAARRAAPAADFRLADLRDPLPFADGRFGAIVANLSLHYLRRAATERIVGEVRRCLRAGGHLLARVNSTGDVNYGAVGHPQVEPGCFVVDGVQKRFFDRADLERLFARGWDVRGLAERTVHCYGEAKVLWELAARAV